VVTRGGIRAAHLGALVALLTAAVPRRAEAHAIHSTLTEVTLARDGTVTVRIRVFADDFSVAVSRLARVAPRPDHAVADGLVARYLDATVALAGRGVTAPLAFVSQRRTGDVLWLELRGSARDLSGARVRNAMLFEVHRDQVNVVRASYAATSFTTLFSPGDGPKALP